MRTHFLNLGLVISTILCGNSSLFAGECKTCSNGSCTLPTPFQRPITPPLLQVPTMFAQTDIFNLDKWVMVGKDLGIGTMFALVLLALGACGSFYVLRAGFGRQGFVREFFTGVKNAAIQFLDRLTQTLDRLESAAAESRDYHKQQAATCQAMLEAHVEPAGPCNLTGIRAAATHGLDALESIGQKVGADVARHVEAAKDKLAP